MLKEISFGKKRQNAVFLMNILQVYHITIGIKINFFNNLPIRQVIAIVYLLRKTSTCAKQRGTMPFDV